jgi:hypothetical protein
LLNIDSIQLKVPTTLLVYGLVRILPVPIVFGRKMPRSGCNREKSPILHGSNRNSIDNISKAFHLIHELSSVLVIVNTYALVASTDPKIVIV